MSKHHESQVELTPEQIAAAAAATAVAAKAAAAEAKAAEKAQKKAEADAAKAAAKNEKAAAVAAKKAEVEAVKAAKAAERDAKVQGKEAKKAEIEAAKAAKEQAIADAKAAKLSQRQPEQNGIRRPGPSGLCGRVWGLADTLSAALNQPVPIADLLKAGEAESLNPSNIRTEYARWKKFHGVAGRVVKPVAAETAAA